MWIDSAAVVAELAELTAAPPYRNPGKSTASPDGRAPGGLSPWDVTVASWAHTDKMNYARHGPRIDRPQRISSSN